MSETQVLFLHHLDGRNDEAGHEAKSDGSICHGDHVNMNEEILHTKDAIG